MAYRDLLQRRADAWNNLLSEHPDLPEYVIPWEKLPPEVRERMTGPMPWDNDPFARAQREAPENSSPEERRVHYEDLELRVVALSKDELEITAYFRKRGTLHLQPITQATGHNNTIVAVFADRVEVRSGWQSQNVESVGLRDVSSVKIKGLVNVTLDIVNNTGRVYQLHRMALPDARSVKAAVERQKQKAGLYE